MTTSKHQNQYTSLLATFLTLLLVSVLAACSQNGFSARSAASSDNSTSAVPDPSPTPTVTPTPSPSPSPSPTPVYKAEALTWESSSHPERTAWSTALMGFVRAQFSTLNKATDLTEFCPRYNSLSQEQKINLIADIFAATSYYESGWDPKNYSVDVGTANDPNTWSVGLLQLSVVDQSNYGFSFGFNFNDLQDPIKNLQLGVAIMAKQITKHGVFMIVSGSGLYWSTLHPGGRYDQSANIEQRTKKLSFCQ